MKKDHGLGFVVGYQSEPLVLVAGDGEEFAAAAVDSLRRRRGLPVLPRTPPPLPSPRPSPVPPPTAHAAPISSTSSLRPAASRRQDPGPPRRCSARRSLAEWRRSLRAAPPLPPATQAARYAASISEERRISG